MRPVIQYPPPPGNNLVDVLPLMADDGVQASCDRQASIQLPEHDRQTQCFAKGERQVPSGGGLLIVEEGQEGMDAYQLLFWYRLTLDAAEVKVAGLATAQMYPAPPPPQR